MSDRIIAGAFYALALVLITLPVACVVLVLS
jgi:hypothetical protein